MSGELIFLLLSIAVLAYVFWSRQPQGWLVRWSEGTPKRPTAQGNGWYIDVPRAGAGHLNDILFHVLFTKKDFLKGVKSITLRGSITGGGFVLMEKFDIKTHPASMTLILQRRGDKPRDEPKYMPYRWYSKEMIPLVAGPFEATFPLNVENMGDVKNGHDPAAFQAALGDLLGFGIGFGSAGGRAHGIATSESAQILLSSYTLNR